MKKLLTLTAVAMVATQIGYAGDYLTNTNYSASFLRNPAQGASTDISGVFSNPAGMSFLKKEGFHISLNGQSAYQTRTIVSESQAWASYDGKTSHSFEGKASAPIIPSIFAAYKQGNWTLSGGFAITGGGGKASFGDGLPMFQLPIVAGLGQLAKISNVPSKTYTYSSSLDGRQYIYGGQLGLSYQIKPWLSGYVGGRMNYFSGGYEGFINVKMDQSAANLLDARLDLNQTGWGLTPILGLDFKFDKFNFGVKYEFNTHMNIENQTKAIDVTSSVPTLGKLVEGGLSGYKDGVNTPSDIPSMLSVAGQYSILPSLRVSAEWHMFGDKNARMADDKQKSLKHNTFEYIAGLEWDVKDLITLSAGYQNTNYGLSDEFQSNTSFYCDSYSIGLGARVHLTEALNLDLGYFWTNYKDYSKDSKLMNVLDVHETYGRTNKVFGLGVNYSF